MKQDYMSVRFIVATINVNLQWQRKEYYGELFNQSEGYEFLLFFSCHF